MSRLFVEHHVRKVLPLDGVWDIYFPKEGNKIFIDDIESCEIRSLVVPGVWETLIGRENYRGQALAVKDFEVNSDCAARLVFKGVSHTAELFLDGKKLGDHHNAYTPFVFDIPRISRGKHRIAVIISNEHGELSALHIPNDYYNYGGISRPVELQILKGNAYIRFNHFTPCRTPENSWRAKFAVRVVNLGEDFSCDIRISLAGKTVVLEETQIKSGETDFYAEIDFDSEIALWEPKHGHLYRLETELISRAGEILDDLFDRVGFRVIDIDGRKILINGKPTFLYGVNRHEDHPFHGCAQTLDTIYQDMDIILDIGANAVRTSHYPNDERFLDLCDEHGIMVWEENHARGLNLEKMKHSRFREQCRNCISEMIEWHYNHPSIVIWGILNECSSETEEGKALYKEQFEQIKSLDSSRPTTYASDKHFKDICQDLPDICSWNLYSNWYEGNTAKKGLEALINWQESNEGRSKPLIISEFGGGAIPGYFDPRRKSKWSEERQAEILDECLSEYLSNPRLSGAFIWQFCDIRVDESWALGRPRTMNNKGIVNEYRRPKLSYEVVKKHFSRMIK